MKLTQTQVETHFLREDFELVFATEAQIDELCAKLDDDTPRMHWNMCKEDVEFMLESVRREFGVPFGTSR